LLRTNVWVNANEEKKRRDSISVDHVPPVMRFI
jgi:hypothetical protein